MMCDMCLLLYASSSGGGSPKTTAAVKPSLPIVLCCQAHTYNISACGEATCSRTARTLEASSHL